MTEAKPASSGEKYRTALGFSAIKDGVKSASGKPRPTGAKPPWLRVRLGGGPRFEAVCSTVRSHRLATVCEESRCPNIGECWDNGTATLMLMGSVCPRACRFCSVDTGNPNGWGWMPASRRRRLRVGAAWLTSTTRSTASAFSSPDTKAWSARPSSAPFAATVAARS